MTLVDLPERHHQPLRRDERFVALCDLAERMGLQVKLDVGAHRLGHKGQEYRALGPLAIGIPERPVMMLEYITYGRSLGHAAAIAVERLRKMRR
jgi:hypothetical protein